MLTTIFSAFLFIPFSNPFIVFCFLSLFGVSTSLVALNFAAVAGKAKLAMNVYVIFTLFLSAPVYLYSPVFTGGPTDTNFVTHTLSLSFIQTHTYTYKVSIPLGAVFDPF